MAKPWSSATLFGGKLLGLLGRGSITYYLDLRVAIAVVSMLVDCYRNTGEQRHVDSQEDSLSSRAQRFGGIQSAPHLTR